MEAAERRMLPDLISTAEPGSFARSTVTERHPRIISQVREDNDLDAGAVRKLEGLEEEMKTGVVSDPVSQRKANPSLFQKEELSRWSRAIARYAGRSWLDIPWYFAESFFYFKLLWAIGYYDEQSPSFQRDPYQAQKNRELLIGGGAIAAADQLSGLLGQIGEHEGGDEVPYREFIMASLWGNRIDLSNATVVEQSRKSFLDKDTHELPVDQSDELCRLMASVTRLDLVMDNSGPELVSDLFLSLLFLSTSPDSLVRLHVKNAPFYVSDSMKKDVETTISVLAGVPDDLIALRGRELVEYRRRGRLEIAPHWFWNGPECFDGLPGDLRSDLGDSELVIVKGDANYRRLLGDRKWRSTAVMDDIAVHFPRPFAVLRTLKSELIVDLAPGVAERIKAEDSDWLLNGKRGIIRVCT